MLRFAMISKWHVHAKGYADFVRNQDDAKITCVWDEDAKRGLEWADELGVDFVEDYDQVLARSDVDAILVCTPTNAHKELMIKAANAKKHIFTEKVLALTTEDADAIIAAVKENGVKFSICFPHRCMPRNLFVKQLIDDGVLGDVTVMRVRNCHNGALAGWLPDYWYDPVTTGGGAMMDLGAHGMYLSHWLLGNPVRIQSMFNNLTPVPVDDNAISTIEFENKAISIAETSLVSPMTPTRLEVYGTKGVVMCEDDDVKFQNEFTQKYVAGGWVKPKLPKALPHPIRQFIDGVLYGKEIIFGLDEARMLTLLMEKAYVADKERREVTF
ncbi:MAG: Gfo/Idh/MocA family protein [Christensenellales bacterium]|jgi:1,5-anhydro-D-fructose reductase (1,5-anhydro-D-mannitol-forming)